MAKKKKKNSAADKLIDSLMNDLSEAPRENTISQGKTSTSIARSSDLIRDLEKEIELSSQAKPVEKTKHKVKVIITEAPEQDDVHSDPFDSPFDARPDVKYEADDVVDFDSVLGDSELPSFGAPSHQSDSASNESLEALFKKDYPDYNPEAVPEGILAPESEDESTRPVISSDQTVSIQQEPYGGLSSVTGVGDREQTLAVEGFANLKSKNHKKSDVDVKVSIGGFRGGRTGGNVMTSMDASLVQSENLRLAQQRILDLEKEIENLRGENEELASAAEIIRSRADEMSVHVGHHEKEKQEIQESFQSEIIVLRGNLQYKETELAKSRLKIDELETRLKSDFKKIRVRERELENRLELLRAEKSALVRSKDEYILDLKRKIDQVDSELDNYRKKVLELNRTIDANQEQVKRTERALRLALNNLEAQEENLVPLKKAE